MAIHPDKFDEKGTAKPTRQTQRAAAPGQPRLVIPQPPPTIVQPPIQTGQLPRVSGARLWLIAVIAVIIVIGIVVAISTSQSGRNGQSQFQNPQLVDAERAVRDAVDSWVQAFRSRDTSGLAASYAPVVENYSGKANVSREKIQRQLETAFARISEISVYKVDNVTIEIQPAYSRAVATFHKEWATPLTDGRTYSGEEIEKLTFKNSAEGWKIIREEHNIKWKSTQ